ncbi:hypothetical protein BJ912DRAFT_1061861 [Pholiota molesta]|nr:hypothetical protein BJ912DRAFT_1061861 [Pholiota molesta]
MPDYRPLPGVKAGFGLRGSTMAFMGAVAVVTALTGSYFVKRDALKKEGKADPYEHNGQAAMNSSEVSAAVSIPKPGPRNPRLYTHPKPEG